MAEGLIAGTSMAFESASIVGISSGTSTKLGLSWANVAGASTIAHSKVTLQYHKPTKLVDGQIRVSPLRAIVNQGAKEWEHCLIGYFLGSRLPFPVIRSIAMRLWMKAGLFDVIAQNNGFLLFQFSND